MIRVTTNGTLYTYQKNLMKSTNQLYSAMNAMMTGRNFDTYAADPAAATRAFKLHSSLNATNAQAANNTTVYNKFSTAWDVADDMINDLVTDLAQVPTLEALNDPTGLSTLNTEGQIVFSGAEAVVQSLNNKYDNNFIFGGTDTKNPPFAIVTENGKSYVTYRNVRLDDPDKAYYQKDYEDAEGNKVLKADGTPMTNQEMIDSWADEHQYVDIGIGFTVKDGKVVDSTAFDAAISGAEFVGGAGLDEDGDPKNIVSIMVRLSEIFQDYDEDSGTWGDAGDKEDAARLMGKLTAAQDNLSAQHTALDTQSKFLKTNLEQLNSSFASMNTELDGIEKVDEVDAILALSWAQTSYNAAIQVGANVIPQSLMDYLN